MFRVRVLSTDTPIVFAVTDQKHLGELTYELAIAQCMVTVEIEQIPHLDHVAAAANHLAQSLHAMNRAGTPSLAWETPGSYYDSVKQALIGAIADIFGGGSRPIAQDVYEFMLTCDESVEDALNGNSIMRAKTMTLTSVTEQFFAHARA